MRIFLIPALLFVLISCKPKEKEILNPILSEDFEVFYEKFHTDSLFQMEHILFPLQGHIRLLENQIEIINPIIWEPEDWVLHKPFDDFGGTFERKFYMTGNTFIEKINDRSNFFKMERRFTRFGEEWTLIYYGANR